MFVSIIRVYLNVSVKIGMALRKELVTRRDEHLANWNNAEKTSVALEEHPVTLEGSRGDEHGLAQEWHAQIVKQYTKLLPYANCFQVKDAEKTSMALAQA